MSIRPSAKAVIIHEGYLLAIKKCDTHGDFFILPGGGQEYGENLMEAVKRECVEEIGTTVEVGDLIFVRDYIGKNHEYAADERERQVHALELMFRCTLPLNCTVQVGDHPDEGQVGVEWLPLSEIMHFRLYPKAIRQHLMELPLHSNPRTVYLGDTN